MNPLSEGLDARHTVTSGISKSLALRQQEAEILMLTGIAQSDASAAMIEHLTSAVSRHEARRRPRGGAELKQLADAVAAVVGGVLIPDLRRGTMVFQSRAEAAFAGGIIGYKPAIVALDGLTAAGYLSHYSGVRFERQELFGEAKSWSGLASRYEATDALRQLAAAHGIDGGNVRQHFGQRFLSKAEKVSNPVRLKRQRPRRKSGGAERLLPVPKGDETYARLRAEVRLANRVLAKASWSGCQPPQVFRTFRDSWTLGGRWIVAGKPSIQVMPPEARLCLLIDGGAVVEIDARGSQISILAALAGAAELGDDPYQLGPLRAFGRDVVKDAITATLGSGHLRDRWPPGMDHSAVVSMAEMNAAVMAAHPYLRDLAGLLNVPRSSAALRLQNLEATALSAALLPLWRGGIPAVPIHDGVLVPAGAETAADRAMRDGYRMATGAVIVTRKDSSAGRFQTLP